MSDYSLSYLCEKEDVGKEVEKTVSVFPKRGQSDFLTIYWDTVCEVDDTFVKLIDLYIFYCLSFFSRYQ